MDRIVTLTDGSTIEVKAVSSEFIALAKRARTKKLKEAGLLIEVPTYTVTTDTGKVETYEHNESTLQSDADHEAWSKYQAAQLELSTQLNDLESKLWLTKGVVYEVSDEWMAECAELDIVVPEDRIERGWLYLTTSVLKSPDDFINVISRIQTLSYAGAVSPEEIDTLVDSFRDSIFTRRNGDTPPGTEDAEGQVEAQPKTRTVTRRKGVGKTSK